MSTAETLLWCACIFAGIAVFAAFAVRDWWRERALQRHLGAWPQRGGFVLPRDERNE